jgi:hypothetical protein
VFSSGTSLLGEVVNKSRPQSTSVFCSGTVSSKVVNLSHCSTPAVSAGPSPGKEGATNTSPGKGVSANSRRQSTSVFSSGTSPEKEVFYKSRRQFTSVFSSGTSLDITEVVYKSRLPATSVVSSGTSPNREVVYKSRQPTTSVVSSGTFLLGEVVTKPRLPITSVVSSGAFPEKGALITTRLPVAALRVRAARHWPLEPCHCIAYCTCHEWQ